MANKVLKKVKKYLTKKSNASLSSQHIKAVDKRNKAIEEAFKGNF